MKIAKGYAEEIVNVETICPYCEENQVDCQINYCEIGFTIDYICEVCGKEFKIEVE